jgi:DNA invertase Pin-like site-specific DNA recombinase
MSTLTKSENPMRVAIYTRYSSDIQNELSLEDQEKRCRKEIVARGGTIVGTYSDAAKSGWSLDREGFNHLRADAERGRFDAVMLWKFDRLARNHEQSVLIKILLRRDYGLKLFCVEGFSEDDDNSPHTSMMEQLLAVFYAFYSKNLSSDTKRAKVSRVEEGKFNGSVAPLGYILVTIALATLERPAGLYIQWRIAAIVRRAFKLYATGMYSDAKIADWMNSKKDIQKLRAGKLPINKEMVRDMLQNRTYLGEVCHSDTEYSGSLGEGKKSARKRKEWFHGNHEGFISAELFEQCQKIRAGMSKTFKSASTMRIYPLHDRVYCALCIANKPIGLVDDNYGRMRPSFIKKNDRAWYRCLARSRGYGKCAELFIAADELDRQVVDILSNLVIPEGLRERVESAVRTRVEDEASSKRIAEIEEVIKRVDLRWEEGFINKDEYLEKRRQLQCELDALRPVDYAELAEATHMLTHFDTYWDSCAKQVNPAEARKQLVAKIVERVFIHDRKVLALVLHGSFGVILGENETASTDVVNAVQGVLLSDGITLDLGTCQHGSDGDRTRDLRLDRPTC